MLKISAVNLIGNPEIPIHYTSLGQVEQALLPEKIPYINKDGQLRKGHRYMTQIQLGMWATGAKYTDLFLWTSEEQKIVKVYPDPLI